MLALETARPRSSAGCEVAAVPAVTQESKAVTHSQASAQAGAKDLDGWTLG